MSTEDFFSGRGSPALLSTKEPALRMLKEKYSETFALTKGAKDQVHLFLIKYGMWALVYTFTKKDYDPSLEGSEVRKTLHFLESTLKSNPLYLDLPVEKAKKRIEERRKKILV